MPRKIGNVQKNSKVVDLFILDLLPSSNQLLRIEIDLA